MTTASRTVKTIVVRGDHCLLNPIGLIPASLNLAVIEHAHTNKYRTGLATISVTRPLRSESLTTRFERNPDFAPTNVTATLVAYRTDQQFRLAISESDRFLRK